MKLKSFIFASNLHDFIYTPSLEPERMGGSEVGWGDLKQITHMHTESGTGKANTVNITNQSSLVYTLECLYDFSAHNVLQTLNTLPNVSPHTAL